jgi:hypothetical protein
MAKHRPPNDPEYRRWYDRGWRYSARPSCSLDYGDSIGAPGAWYDGYLDRATDGEKWHSYYWMRAPVDDRSSGGTGDMTERGV